MHPPPHTHPPQEVLAQLETRQVLAFVREPTNPYDPDAVRIETLAGAQVGYVPATPPLTPDFTFETSFGRVLSVGKAQGSDLLGAVVAAQPALPPLAPPPAGAARCEPSAGPTAAAWAARSAAALARAGGRCEVTCVAAGPAAPLAPMPLYRAHAEQGVLQLVGALAVSAAVHRALAALATREEGAERADAARLLAAVNGWSEGEAAEYLSGRRALDAITDWQLTAPPQE